MQKYIFYNIRVLYTGICTEICIKKCTKVPFSSRIYYHVVMGTILIVQKFEFLISTEMHVLRSPESESTVLKKCLSVCLSVCLCVTCSPFFSQTVNRRAFKFGIRLKGKKLIVGNYLGFLQGVPKRRYWKLNVLIFN